MHEEGGEEEGEGEDQVEHLQAVLEQETKSRQQQQELNSKLQDEYDLLLKKLAQAELHIDQLRLGANVDINRRFILSHQVVRPHGSVLQQGNTSYSTHTPSSTNATWGNTAAGAQVSWKEGSVAILLKMLAHRERGCNLADLAGVSFCK